MGKSAFGISFGVEVNVLKEPPGPQRITAWKPATGSDVACGIVRGRCDRCRTVLLTAAWEGRKSRDPGDSSQSCFDCCDSYCTGRSSLSMRPSMLQVRRGVERVTPRGQKVKMTRTRPPTEAGACQAPRLPQPHHKQQQGASAGGNTTTHHAHPAAPCTEPCRASTTTATTGASHRQTAARRSDSTSRCSSPSLLRRLGLPPGSGAHARAAWTTVRTMT